MGAEPLNFEPVDPSTRALVRLHGTADTVSGPKRWSLIAKSIVAPPGASACKPRSWNYWRRERLAYSARWLERGARGLEVARMVGSQTVSRREQVLFLEEVTERRRRWTSSDFETAAYRLGQFGGSFARAHARRRVRWLAKDFLRTMFADLKPLQNLLRTQRVRTSEHLRSALTSASSHFLVRLTERVPLLLRELPSLPQTVCHFDAHRPNLFLQGTGAKTRMVAIDWSHIGTGAVGEDLSQLICGAVWWQNDVNASTYPKFERRCFDAYVNGVHMFAPRVSRDDISRAYFIAMGVRTATFLPVFVDALASSDAADFWRNLYKLKPAAGRHRWARGTQFLVNLLSSNL